MLSHTDFDDFVNKNAINLLVVEDFLPDFKLLKYTLESNHFKVNIYNAKHGQEALDFLKETLTTTPTAIPDVILLDIRMPVMDGHEFLQKIKQDKDFKHIPVIIMSISKDEEDIAKSYDEHANAYIIKPIDINEFVFTIKSLGVFWFTVVKLPPRDEYSI